MRRLKPSQAFRRFCHLHKRTSWCYTCEFAKYTPSCEERWIDKNCNVNIEVEKNLQRRVNAYQRECVKKHRSKMYLEG